MTDRGFGAGGGAVCFFLLAFLVCCWSPCNLLPFMLCLVSYYSLIFYDTDAYLKKPSIKEYLSTSCWKTVSIKR